MGIVGTHKFEVEACNTAGVCGPIKSFNVNVKPGKVASFTASETHVREGKTISLEWQPPAPIHSTLYYNVYVTKPGDVRWRYKTLTSDTSFNRYMAIVGTHIFEVEACNIDNICGEVSTLSVNVEAPLPVPEQLASFTVSSGTVVESDTLTFNWQPPASFPESEEIFYNFYITKPGDVRWRYKTLMTGTSLNRYMQILGTHVFEVEACNADSICGPVSIIEVPVTPGAINNFNVSKTDVVEGERIYFDWQPPTSFPTGETVYYNFYITKPGDRRWRYKTLITDISLSRYMAIEGTHIFEVEACNVDDICGDVSILSVNVKPIGAVSSFEVSKTETAEGETINFNWQPPTSFPEGEAVYYNLYITKPGDRRWRYKTLITDTSLNRYMQILGTHVFEVEACNQAGTICGSTTTITVDVTETGPAIEIIVDNKDPNTVSTGNWVVSSLSGYGEDTIYNNGGGTFEWHFDVPHDGDYQVYAWWADYSNRVSNAPYTIHSGDTATTVTVNQKDPSIGDRWVSIGSYNMLAANTNYVSIVGGKSYTSADAIKVVPVVSSDTEIIVDNLDIGASSTGDWNTSTGLSPYAGNSAYNNNGGTFDWHFNLAEAGQYQVFAWWTHTSSRAANVPFTIYHEGSSTEVVVNQQGASLAGKWISLGVYPFTAGNAGYVSLLGVAGNSSADAIKLVRAPSFNIKIELLGKPADNF